MMSAILELQIGNAGRIVYSTASNYRLVRKKSGELVLQGAFRWEQGAAGGFEWEDIPTENE